MYRRIALALLLSLSSLSVASAVAPGAPQNLAATINGNNVTFAWDGPSTGGVPSGYILEAALSPGGVLIATLPVATSPFTVPSVPNGVYYVAVRSMNADGSSERSNEVVVSVPSGGGGGGCASVPNSPQNLTGSASGNLVTVAWSPSSSGCAATSYAVQAGSSPGLSDITVANVGAATSLTASAPPNTYYIRVVALNAFGGSSASNEIVVTVGSPTPTNPCPPGSAAPPIPTMFTPTVSGASVALSWTPTPGALLYAVHASATTSLGEERLNVTTAVTSYQWLNAPAGISYVHVHAIGLCAGSSPSNQVIVSVTAPTSRYRVGATCNDGTSSTATGSGACSHHGGVRCWRYSDNTCTMPDERDPFKPAESLPPVSIDDATISG